MGAREDPIHIFALKWLRLSLKGAVVHHSPNESPSNVNKGWKHRNYKMGTVTGWPDLEAIWNGHVLFLEIKAPKGRITQTQEDVAVRLQAAGAHYYVVRSPEQAMAAVEDFKLAVMAESEA